MEVTKDSRWKRGDPKIKKNEKRKEDLPGN